MASKKTARTLTIYLLAEGGNNSDYYVRDDIAINKIELRVISGQTWSLFVRDKKPVYPPWSDFFEGHVQPGVFGEVRSAAAVLILKIDNRWFAATFGHSRFLLRESAIVEGFGLRVALAALGEASMRSLDKTTLDAIAGQARLQASRDASVGEFAIDIERELVRSVTGTPDDINLAKRLTGRDALGIVVNVKLEDLPDLLLRMKQSYDNRSGDSHPLIDNIREVRGKENIDRLDEALLQRIISNELDGTWLAPPEILDWALVRYFTYGQSQMAPRHIDIRWDTYFLETDQSSLSVRKLKSQKILCLDDDESTIASWPVHKCIYAEINYGGSTYLLNAGTWYSVADDFVDEVDKFYETIPYFDNFLPEYNDKSEAAYNERVANENPDFFMMDRKLIPYGRGRNKIEFCDLISKTGDIVHVKRYSGSSELSHLFNQALVSGELTLVDGNFRDLVNTKLLAPFQIPGSGVDFEPSKYRVVFGVISQSKSLLSG